MAQARVPTVTDRVPITTLQKRTEVLSKHSGDKLKQIIIDSDELDSVILDKKTLRALVRNSYCEVCGCSGEISFTNVDTNVVVSVQYNVCNETLFI